MVGRIFSFVLLFHGAPAIGCESQSTELCPGEEFMPPKQHKSILAQDITTFWEGEVGKEGPWGQAGERECATFWEGLCSRGEGLFGASEPGN